MADSQFVYVRKPDGGIARMPAAEFAANPDNFLKQGLVPIEPGNVTAAIAERRAAKLQEAQDIERRAAAATPGGMLKTAGEGLATGAVDAFTALPRAASAIGAHVTGGEDPLAGMTGRGLLETGAYTVAGGGTQGAVAAQQYAANARARATENPVVSTGSSIAGQILGAGGVSALGRGAGTAATKALGGGMAARIAGAGVTGALEGAPLGLVQAQDQAYIENRKLTGEQAMAALGVGVLLGGGLGVGLKGAGELAGAVRNKAASYFASRAGTITPAAETTAESAATEALMSARDKELARTFEGATGQKALPETPQLIREGFANHGDLSAVADKAHSDATERLATALNESDKATEKLARKVSNKEWKLGQVAEKADTFAPDALEQVQARSAAIRQDIKDSIEGLGKSAPKALKELAARVDASDLTIQGAKVADKAYIAFDQTRRDLHAVSEAFQRVTGNAGNVDTLSLHRALGDRIGAHYDEAANFLMDEGVWGAQGKAQKAVNTAFPDFIEAKRFAQPEFAKQVGEDYLGRGRVTPNMEVHEGKLLSQVQKFGTTEGKFAERRLRQYIGSMNDFASAFESHSLSAEEKALVDTVKKHAASLETTLSEARQKVGAVKQAQAFVEKAAESPRGRVADILGHVTAGTQAGEAVQSMGIASNSARQVQQRLAVERLAAKAQAITGGSLDKFFDGMRTVSQKVGEVAKKIPVPPPLPTALELFQGRHATPEVAYTKRVQELQQANANFGQGIRNGAERSFGTLAADDPHAVNAAVVAGSKGVQALLSALPVGTFNPKSLTPNASRPTPTRLEIQQFADVWTAVMKPMEVVKQIPNGTVTVPQMKALQQVYPSYYNAIRQDVVERLAKLDESGTEVPIHAIDTLDVLLDLGDAAGPTYATAFAVKYSQQMGDTAAKQRQPKPPKPSAKGSIGQRLSAGTSAMFIGGGS